MPENNNMQVNNNNFNNNNMAAHRAANIKWMERKEVAMKNIHEGMNPEQQTKALLDAAAKGDYHLVFELLVGGVINVPVDSVDEDGNTAFHIAAQHGHRRVIISLLSDEWTVDILNMRNNAGKTAAEEAAERGYGAIVELLTEHGAALGVRNGNNHNGGRRSKSRKVKRSKSRKVKRSKSRKVNRKH